MLKWGWGTKMTELVNLTRFGCKGDLLFLSKAKSQGLFGPPREKTCLRGFANNTGANQPAHPRSLISAFVIRFLERTIFNLATGKISIF